MKRFCRILTENGYKVALICRHQGGLEANQFPPHMEFYQLSSDSFYIKLREIFSILDNFKPDIVHTHYLTKDCIIPALKIGRKYQYYISIWGSDINIFSTNFFNRIIQNLGLLLCNKLHLLSPYFEKKILKLYYFIPKSKYEIFSWGVEFAFLTSPKEIEIEQMKKECKIGGDNLIVLCYRNHKELYNHHTLIKSIPQIIDEFPTTKFIFTRGSYSKTYKDQTFKLVKDLKVEKNFLFIDRWLSDTELRALINIADININIPFRDGLPATLFEIMSTSAVPIISDLDNYHPFFKDKINGIYLNMVDNHQELSRIIISVFRDLGHYKGIFPKNNNEYVRNYQNWEIQSKMFLDFYN
jgi:glycosyltransferase involved in cell wall biosynthesis